jgi:hypothetical protein
MEECPKKLARIEKLKEAERNYALARKLGAERAHFKMKLILAEEDVQDCQNCKDKTC